MNQNSMDALFSGLTGNTIPSEKTAPAAEVKKSNNKAICTKADADLYQKIRIIAAQEKLDIVDVINASFRLAISKYEAEKGPVQGTERGNPDQLFK